MCLLTYSPRSPSGSLVPLDPLNAPNGPPISPAALTHRPFPEMTRIKYRIRRLQYPEELRLNSACLSGIKNAVPPVANTELSPRDLAEPRGGPKATQHPFCPGRRSQQVSHPCWIKGTTLSRKPSCQAGKQSDYREGTSRDDKVTARGQGPGPASAAPMRTHGDRVWAQSQHREPFPSPQGWERAPTIGICPDAKGSPAAPRAGAVTWAPTQCRAVGIRQGECEGQVTAALICQDSDRK